MKHLIQGFLLLFLVFISISYPQKRAFTIEDLYKVKNVSAPVLSNSGDRIAFTVSESDLTKGKTTTHCLCDEYKWFVID